MRKRDKFNMLGNFFDEKEKAEKEKKRNSDYHKARAKGTGNTEANKNMQRKHG